MVTKSKIKSNNQKRGGKRPGAGRPRTSVVNAEQSSRRALLREAAVEVAMGGLDRALKAYEPDSEFLFTPLQSRWHLAMVLFGVPPDTIGEALLKPGTSGRFRAAILAALDAVKAEAFR
jgi:hypothetical protein